MKVAVLFCGQPRNVKSGYEYISKNLLELNDCDVFAHVWHNSDMVGKSYNSVYDGSALSNPIESDVLSVINDLYKPRIMEVEKQIQFDTTRFEPLRAPMTTAFNNVSQLYSLKLANSLRKHYEFFNGPIYDAVVRIRFDWALKIPIKLSDYDLNLVHVPNGCPHRDGVVDQFAFSNPKNMDVYCSQYDSLDELANRKILFTGEVITLQHLLMNNIKVNVIQELMYPHAFDILRK